MSSNNPGVIDPENMVRRTDPKHKVILKVNSRETCENSRKHGIDSDWLKLDRTTYKLDEKATTALEIRLKTVIK